jgi:MraZ protein
MFEGILPTTIDARGRLLLPRPVLDALDERVGDRRLFVTSLDGVGVRLYPLEAWEAVEARLNAGSDASAESKFRATKIQFVANSYGREVEIDPSGFVLLPSRLR